MNDLQIKQLALLDETVAHFNSTNRGYKKVNGVPSCHYSPSPTSDGCAIGRLIKDKSLCKEFDRKKDEGIATFFSQLPEELKEYTLPFLRHLQKFHDNIGSWDKNGLTELGKVNYDKFKELYKLN